MEPQKKKTRRRLSVEEKRNIYQQCETPGVKIGELLRAHGLYSSDLQLIRRHLE